MVALRDCLSTQNVLRKFWSQFAGCRRLILSNVRIAYHSTKLSLKLRFRYSQDTVAITSSVLWISRVFVNVALILISVQN